MNIDDYINYNGWEFSARMAFNQMNGYREVYPVLPRDKKVKLDTLRFILPTTIGQVIITNDVTIEDIKDAINVLYTFFKGE